MRAQHGAWCPYRGGRLLPLSDPPSRLELRPRPRVFHLSNCLRVLLFLAHLPSHFPTQWSSSLSSAESSWGRRQLTPLILRPRLFSSLSALPSLCAPCPILRRALSPCLTADTGRRMREDPTLSLFAQPPLVSHLDRRMRPVYRNRISTVEWVRSRA